MTSVEERKRNCLLCQVPFTRPRRPGRPRRYCRACAPIMDAMLRRIARGNIGQRSERAHRASNARPTTSERDTLSAVIFRDPLASVTPRYRAASFVVPDTRQRLLQIAGLDNRIHRRSCPAAGCSEGRHAGFGPWRPGLRASPFAARLQDQFQLDIPPLGPHERAVLLTPPFGSSPANRLLGKHQIVWGQMWRTSTVEPLNLARLRLRPNETCSKPPDRVRSHGGSCR